MMPVRLRGHHFLCMLTYRGLGYSAQFTANMSARIELIKNGAPILLVTGPDDICAGMSQACSNATGHDCSGNDITVMDVMAQKSVEAVLNRQLATAMPITAPELTLLRAAFSNGSIRQACTGCSWFELCNHIASNHFSKTQLLNQAQ